MRVGIVVPPVELKDVHNLPSQHTDTAALSGEPSAQLFFCAAKAQGLSGRALRKLPFLAHAKFLRSKVVSIDKYCQALLQAIEAEHAARRHEGGDGRSLGQ
jgi:hypothetical protein